jgi:hypothetical protein
MFLELRAVAILISFAAGKPAPEANECPDERARRIKKNDYTFFGASNQEFLLLLI